VGAHRILTGEKRKIGKPEAESETIRAQRRRLVTVRLADDAVYGRPSMRTIPIETPGARPSGECNSPLTTSWSPILWRCSAAPLTCPGPERSRLVTA
jgi:hypothetical protein